MEFKLNINIDNSSFDLPDNDYSDTRDAAQIAKVLQKVATELSLTQWVNNESEAGIFDINGNAIGIWQIIDSACPYCQLEMIEGEDGLYCPNEMCLNDC